MIIPELSAGSLPPYNPLVSSAGIPSIWNSVTSFLNEPGALPKTSNPPHNPTLEASRFVPFFWPRAISSATDVIIIGLSAVPWASILPPLAIQIKEESVPVPPSALIIVPAGMVNVAPSAINTLPFNVQILSALKVLSLVYVPPNVKLPLTFIVAVAILLSAIPSLAL